MPAVKIFPALNLNKFPKNLNIEFQALSSPNSLAFQYPKSLEAEASKRRKNAFSPRREKAFCWDLKLRKEDFLRRYYPDQVLRV
jgi:hypothetical protein